MATLKELSAQVDKLDKSLTALKSKAEAINAEMSSGNYGVQQIKELANQLNRVNSSIAKLESSRVKVLDEKSLRDFNILSKQIDTLTSRINTGKGLSSVFAVDDPAYQKAMSSIKNMENALKSLESRKWTQFDAFGRRKAASESFGYTDLGGRLGTMPSASSQPVQSYVPGGATAQPAPSTPPKDFDLPPTPLTDSQKRKAEREAKIAQLKKERDAWLQLNKAVLEYAKAQGIANPEKAYKNTLLGGQPGAFDIHTFQEKNAMGEYQTLKVKADSLGNLSNLQPPKAQQSFTQGLTRDLGELIKWSIAISAIYGPINAASAAIEELIENQSKLADVTISVNEETASTATIFDSVYDAAQGAGESVGGVIDAFGQAFQAAGRVSGQFERYDTAVKLTNDALTLSKLSTLDQAEAIDVLTAALYQTAGANDNAADALGKGASLMDKWVRVSKIAAVTVETLATGVAVLGDSAETAGLNVEQLNALIATLSEVSLSSGKETANVAKALIGNYQQESAVKELGRLGIAVTDTTGKTRQFLDVMSEVAAMRKEGILGDQDFGRLTLALGGGGIRRQKDVQAFLENFERMQEIAGSQGGAAGEAQSALAKKLDTVETSATKLGNSVTSLAQTMGSDGGLLDVFSSVIDFGTGTVDVLDKIAGAVGKLGPLLLGTGIASLLLRGKDLTSILANNVTGPAASWMGATGLGAGVGTAQWLTGQRNVFGGARQPGAFGNLATAPSLASIAIPAAQNFASGDSAEGWANIAGGTLGAMLGGPIGAMAGAAIAEAFVRTTITYKSELSDLFAGYADESTTAGMVGKSVGLGKYGNMTTEQLIREAKREVGFGSETIGSLMPAIEFYVTKGLAKLPGIGQDLYAKNVPQDPNAVMLDALKTINPMLADILKGRWSATGSTATVPTANNVLRQGDIGDQYGGQLGEMQRRESDALLKQLIEGDIKASEYQNKMSNLSAFTTSATNAMSALVGESGKLPDNFKSMEDAFKDYLEIASSGNQELINQINQQIAAADYYEEQLRNWTPGTEITNQLTGTTFTPKDVGEIESLYGQTQTTLANTWAYGAEQSLLQKLVQPNVYGSSVTPTATSSDIDTVVAKAIEAQNKLYAELEPDQYEALKKSFEPFKILVEEAGKTFFKEVTGGISKDIFGQTFQDLQNKGEISKQGGLGFTELDITRPQLEQAVTKANKLTKELEAKGYESNVEDILIATSDDEISTQHTDMKVLQYILNQILDTERKQLQGVWNLPDGSEFWVPLQSIIDDYGKGISGDSTSGNITGHGSTMKTGTGHGSNFKTLDTLSEKDSYSSVKDLIDSVASRSVIQDTDKNKFGQAGSGLESTLPSVLSELINAIRSLKLPIPGFLGGNTAGFKGIDTLSPRGPAQQSSETQSVTTRLDLKLTSTTQLMVDGRVLATIIKPYLAGDLLKSNESGGTITRSFVI